MKKILCGLGTIAFVAIIAINVNVAHTGGRLAGINWKNVIALTNNELKIVFAYDASGNITSRTLVNLSMAPPTPNGTDSIAVVFEEAVDMEETVVVSSKTKSSVFETGDIKAGVATIPTFEDFLSEMQVTIYPNPTNGVLWINISNTDIPQSAQIEIFAGNGLLIGKWKDISPTYTMDITDQPAGIYFLRLTLGKEYVNTWKIIKN